MQILHNAWSFRRVCLLFLFASLNQTSMFLQTLPTFPSAQMLHITAYFTALIVQEVQIHSNNSNWNKDLMSFLICYSIMLNEILVGGALMQFFILSSVKMRSRETVCITYTHHFLNVNEFWLHDWTIDGTYDILVLVHKQLTVGYSKPAVSEKPPSRCEKK